MVDIHAGNIHDHRHAQTICPGVCNQAGLSWNGHWTHISGSRAVCGCV